MKNSKMTPGPWTVERWKPEPTDDREGLAIWGPSTIGHKGLVACLSQTAYISHEDANARAIAAVPELIAACQLIEKWQTGCGPSPTTGEVVEAARAALAKAKP